MNLWLAPIWVGNFELFDGHLALWLHATHLGRHLPSVGQTVALDHAVGNVDSETVDTAVEPELKHLVELVAHHRVAPV